ncbi:fasciclin-like arabinogalactan protein, partial [Trifolium medium]|nr:fasciclin-like arabinogalactan protein [Trifolium medium]
TDGTCSVLDGRCGCAASVTTAAGMSPMPMVEIEDHHGL